MSMDSDQPDLWLQRRESLRGALTPARPVNDRELFAGRQEQMVRVVDTFSAPGEHAAIFGERGVGKTSLATITDQIADLLGNLAIRINCQANDRIEDIWRRIGEGMDRRFRLDQAKGRNRLSHLDGTIQGAVIILTAPSVSTHEALLSLEMLGEDARCVIFLDEFDRVEDPDVHTSFVDLMKTISDHGLPVTIVIVGVADSVDSLIAEHESIGRGFNEIEMPRMSPEELQDILGRGLGQAGMTATPEAAQFISQLSAGLPHYVHLMGLNAGLAAIGDECDLVDLDRVLSTLDVSVSRAQQHVSRLYHAATHSTRPNKFKEVLLAAALTRTDERGYFAPGDMRGPMTTISGRPTAIPQFSDQLIQFANEERGPVLHKTGVVNRPRYRMAEPLLVPYVAMRGVSEGAISPDVLRQLLAER
jgi:Cdc6-like AAA superfamily ATPase